MSLIVFEKCEVCGATKEHLRYRTKLRISHKKAHFCTRACEFHWFRKFRGVTSMKELREWTNPKPTADRGEG